MTDNHNCEETFTLCGLCIECWRVRAEKAEADFALLNARYESELEQTKKLEAERDKALAACAEMRHFILHGVKSCDADALRARIMSSDCGEGWVSPERCAQLQVSALMSAEQRLFQEGWLSPDKANVEQSLASVKEP